MIRDRAYLDWLRDQPCVFCGERGNEYESVVPMHIGTAGKGIKRSDDEALPALNRFHQYGHQHGEVTMLRTCAGVWLIRAAFRAYAREMYRDYLNEAGKRRRET